jgi:cytochrome c-type biogenesis protein CcmH
MTSRRRFLAGSLLGVLPLLTARTRLSGQEGQGEAGALRDPASAGRPRDRATERDNDEYIKQIEHRLQCTCGCTLDIYTCRTTDFTCTFSPALHKEVLALHDEGKNADEIVTAFVAKYGEKVLMAPKPEGFNIAGYVVPGITILLAGGVMAAILARRARVMRAGVEAPAGLPAGAPPLPGVSAEEMERLRRELREFDE